jgi:hypothetical protein
LLFEPSNLFQTASNLFQTRSSLLDHLHYAALSPPIRVDWCALVVSFSSLNAFLPASQIEIQKSKIEVLRPPPKMLRPLLQPRPQKHLGFADIVATLQPPAEITP